MNEDKIIEKLTGALPRNEETYIVKQRKSFKELSDLLLSIKVEGLSDIEQYLYTYIKPFIDTSETIIKNINDKRDLQSAVSLQRNLIDKYASFYLLAIHGKEQEREVRQYLFLIDYFLTQAKLCKNTSSYFSSIFLSDVDIEPESKELCNYLPQKEVVYIEYVENLKEEIKNGGLISVINNKILDGGFWKYNPEYIKNDKKCTRYTFVELYKIASIPDFYSEYVQIFHSSFTHSLGTSLHTEALEIDYITSIVLYFEYNIEILLLRAVSVFFKDHISNYSMDEEIKEDLEMLDYLSENTNFQ